MEGEQLNSPLLGCRKWARKRDLARRCRTSEEEGERQGEEKIFFIFSFPAVAGPCNTRHFFTPPTIQREIRPWRPAGQAFGKHDDVTKLRNLKGVDRTSKHFGWHWWKRTDITQIKQTYCGKESSKSDLLNFDVPLAIKWGGGGTQKLKRSQNIDARNGREEIAPLWIFKYN